MVINWLDKLENIKVITHDEIINLGFRIIKDNSFSDMGQMTVTLYEYSKDNKLFLTGGYWNYFLRDKNGKLLYEGWPTKEEFINEINKY